MDKHSPLVPPLYSDSCKRYCRGVYHTPVIPNKYQRCRCCPAEWEYFLLRLGYRTFCRYSAAENRVYCRKDQARLQLDSSFMFAVISPIIARQTKVDRCAVDGIQRIFVRHGISAWTTGRSCCKFSRSFSSGAAISVTCFRNIQLFTEAGNFRIGLAVKLLPNAVPHCRRKIILR